MSNPDVLLRPTDGRAQQPPTASSAAVRSAARHRSAGWLFVAPALVLAIAVMYVPLGYALYLSMQGKKAAGGLRITQVFVGLDNYLGSLTDP
ncbi:MAG: hypothetical protein VB036_00535, partial [Propionicimonas sp.]|nr:hypothetical protein [Propionicimonas sp.]